MDEPFVSCPYNKFHQVRKSRMQSHVVKCEKKYPELKICPYNATHRVPEEEIITHVRNCPSRASTIPDDKPPKLMGSITTPKPNLQREYLPETDPNHELWDD